MSDVVFDKIAIIGIGLLGSSIAHATHAYGGAKQVALWDVSEDVRSRAPRVVHGAVCDSVEQAVADADCIILCTPVGALDEVTQALSGVAKPGEGRGGYGGALSRRYSPHSRSSNRGYREVRAGGRLRQPVSGGVAYFNPLARSRRGL